MTDEKDKGLAFLEQFGIASFFIVRNKDKFEKYFSSEFLKRLEGNKPKGSQVLLIKLCYRSRIV